MYNGMNNSVDAGTPKQGHKVSPHATREQREDERVERRREAHQTVRQVQPVLGRVVAQQPQGAKHDQGQTGGHQHAHKDQASQHALPVPPEEQSQSLAIVRVLHCQPG